MPQTMNGNRLSHVLDMLGISVPISLCFSKRPGITLVNPLYLVYCPKSWFNKILMSVLPATTLIHGNCC